MQKILQGVLRFSRDVYPERRQLFEHLSDNHFPDVLMITCSDSRIEPSLITQANPGEIFMCRTPGNIVPPSGQAGDGVMASVEYALEVLNIRDIVVCGHSDCRAVMGAIAPNSIAHLPHASAWISNIASAVDTVRAADAALSGAALVDAVIRQNVRVQISHLKSHKLVKEHLKAGTLSIHGWVYDIGRGEVQAFDERQQKFRPITVESES